MAGKSGKVNEPFDPIFLIILAVLGLCSLTYNITNLALVWVERILSPGVYRDIFIGVGIFLILIFVITLLLGNPLSGVDDSDDYHAHR
jgi:hypothetical protein